MWQRIASSEFEWPSDRGNDKCRLVELEIMRGFFSFATPAWDGDNFVPKYGNVKNG